MKRFFEWSGRSDLKVCWLQMCFQRDVRSGFALIDSECGPWECEKRFGASYERAGCNHIAGPRFYYEELDEAHRALQMV